MRGLLSKDYARLRAGLISTDKNDAMAGPGDPYPSEGRSNPYLDLLKKKEAC